MDFAYNDGTVHGDPIYREQFGVTYYNEDLNKIRGVKDPDSDKIRWYLTDENLKLARGRLVDLALDCDGSGIAGHYWFMSEEGRDKFLAICEKEKLLNILKNTQ